MFSVILTFLSMQETSENEIMEQRLLFIAADPIPRWELGSLPGVGTSEQKTPTGILVSEEEGGGHDIGYYWAC